MCGWAWYVEIAKPVERTAFWSREEYAYPGVVRSHVSKEN